MQDEPSVNDQHRRVTQVLFTPAGAGMRSDPRFMEFCERIGLDYVSCSPFRVPIARLAAAQAVIASGEGDK